MRCVVITTPQDGKDWDSTRKETDLSKTGNRKWIVSHLTWAIENRQTVIVAPY
jgi:hypothetical protein